MMARQADFNSPGPSGITAQIPLLLQEGKVMCDAGLACQTYCLGNLPHRRRIAVLVSPIADDLQNLLLAPRQHMTGIRLLRHTGYNGGTVVLTGGAVFMPLHAHVAARLSTIGNF